MRRSRRTQNLLDRTQQWHRESWVMRRSVVHRKHHVETSSFGIKFFFSIAFRNKVFAKCVRRNKITEQISHLVSVSTAVLCYAISVVMRDAVWVCVVCFVCCVVDSHVELACPALVSPVVTEKKCLLLQEVREGKKTTRKIRPLCPIPLWDDTQKCKKSTQNWWLMTSKLE